MLWGWAVEGEGVLSCVGEGAAVTGLVVCELQVCNSKGNCHCHVGWAPPDCLQPGSGGSVDSGPVRRGKRSGPGWLVGAVGGGDGCQGSARVPSFQGGLIPTKVWWVFLFKC